MVRPQRRPPAGHSLVELIVTLALLGATLGAIAATGVFALAETAHAIRLQDAAARAAEALDSLTATGPPGPGSRDEGGVRLEWVVEPGTGGAVRVVVRAMDPATHRPLLELVGGWAPPPPVASAPEPDSAAASEPAP